jgi:hypothetical protein
LDEEGEEECYEAGGSKFTVKVLDGSAEDLGEGGEFTGFCVFEAPLKTDDVALRDKLVCDVLLNNTEDSEMWGTLRIGCRHS